MKTADARLDADGLVRGEADALDVDVTDCELEALLEAETLDVDVTDCELEALLEAETLTELDNDAETESGTHDRKSASSG